jgi:excisionase family DNA binding protein
MKPETQYAVSPLVVRESRGRSVEEFAERVGISRAQGYREVHAGNVGHIRSGKRIIVPDHAIDAYLAQRTGAPRARN